MLVLLVLLVSVELLLVLLVLLLVVVMVIFVVEIVVGDIVPSNHWVRAHVAWLQAHGKDVD